MYIHVRIKTKQKQESIVQISETKFEVSVRAEAKRNEANARMIELVRAHFCAGRVRIISGHHSPSKLLSVD